jgi:hypothetical protein
MPIHLYHIRAFQYLLFAIVSLSNIQPKNGVYQMYYYLRFYAVADSARASTQLIMSPINGML